MLKFDTIVLTNPLEIPYKEASVNSNTRRSVHAALDPALVVKRVPERRARAQADCEFGKNAVAIVTHPRRLEESKERRLQPQWRQFVPAGAGPKVDKAGLGFLRGPGGET